jgi:hypothetical protein
MDQLLLERIEVVCRDGTTVQAAITLFDPDTYAVTPPASAAGLLVMPGRLQFGFLWYASGAVRIVSPRPVEELGAQLRLEIVERYLGDLGYSIKQDGAVH